MTTDNNKSINMAKMLTIQYHVSDIHEDSKRAIFSVLSYIWRLITPITSKIPNTKPAKGIIHGYTHNTPITA